MRIFSTLVRRPDITREAFRDHYEGHHTPLALPVITGLEHYLRNHIAEELAGEPAYFDTLSEFGYESDAAFHANIATMQSDAGADIRADELTFMDKASNHFFAVRPAASPGQGPALSNCVKVVFMEKASAGAHAQDAVAAHVAGLGPLLEDAASWSHWETHPALDLPPVCDAVTLAWFEPERYDAKRLAAWSPDAARFWCFRSDERVSFRTDGPA